MIGLYVVNDLYGRVEKECMLRLDEQKGKVNDD